MQTRTLLRRRIFNNTFVEHWWWSAITLGIVIIICVFMWKEHGRFYLLWFDCQFTLNHKWSLLKQVFVACCSSFDIIARLKFLRKRFFPFSIFSCTLTLQWSKTFPLKIEYTGQCGSQIIKYSCSKGKRFWLVCLDLSIDFARTVLLQKQDVVCIIGCRLFLSLQ